jgi:AraC-like DNA-binding protein
MPDRDIHLVKAAFHAQFKKAMELRGISASHYFKKFKLPVEIHDPESLLPLKPFFQLINILAIEEDIPDFGSFVAQTTPWHRVMSLGPLIESSKNLENLLHTFCDIASSQSSLVKFTLADEVTGHYFCYSDRPIYKGDIQMELYRITSMIQLIQLASGPGWTPETIRLNMPETAAVNDCPLIRKSTLCYSQVDSAISIPSRLLKLPVQMDIPRSLGLGADRNPSRYTEYGYSVRQIIDSYTLVGSMTIEDLAWLTDQSVRTLQRRLKSAGLSFNEMISESRYRHACDKLRNSSMPISEISRLLGYSDAAHFSRAFRRWSALSPTAFRKGREITE